MANQQFYKKIKFSAHYEKLKNINAEEPVTLMEVFIKDREHMEQSFIDYDTTFLGSDKQFPLPEGKYLVLLFNQNGTLFTTIRRYTSHKAAYYFGMRGKKLMVEYVIDTK